MIIKETIYSPQPKYHFYYKNKWADTHWSKGDSSGDPVSDNDFNSTIFDDGSPSNNTSEGNAIKYAYWDISNSKGNANDTPTELRISLDPLFALD